MDFYRVKRFIPQNKIYDFDVPASKSILNRALLLAALAKGDVSLSCGAFGEDTRAMLSCLHALGIKTETKNGDLLVHGCGGNIPVKNARLNVMSAGTAARFLPCALAFCGGEYLFDSSSQMKKRPMEALSILERAGVSFEYLEQRGSFPFLMRSYGIAAESLAADTDASTQYASGLLIAAAGGNKPFTLALTGNRTDGSYIAMTLRLLSDFGVKWERSGGAIRVFPGGTPPKKYTVEGDISGACYFFSLALLFGIKVLVRHVKLDTVQGDVKFLQLLEEKGVRFRDTENGLLADGEGIESFTGFDASFRDFSDQTLTAAALAPFACTPSSLRDVGHIRSQECDRIAAAVRNLNALGVPASAESDRLDIVPAAVKGGTVKSFHDHRVAMAFTLTGLKTGTVTVENPDCCKKTFENYFDLVETLTR